MSRKKSSSSLCDDMYSGSIGIGSADFASGIEAVLGPKSCAGVSGRVGG